jgi:hypothetical protein
MKCDETETFGDTFQCDSFEVAKAPRLIEGTDLFIPESLLMLMDEVDTAKPHKTQFLMLDDEGNEIQSNSDGVECQIQNLSHEAVPLLDSLQKAEQIDFNL